MVGAMAHMFAGKPILRSGASSDDPGLVVQYLIAFLNGGFHAPAVEPAGAACARKVNENWNNITAFCSAGSLG